MDDERVDQLEMKINELDQKLANMTISLNQFSSEYQSKKQSCVEREYKNKGNGGLFVGIVLIITGCYFLAKGLGWFDFHIPIWPVILIVAGIFVVFSGNRDKDDNDGFINLKFKRSK